MDKQANSEPLKIKGAFDYWPRNSRPLDDGELELLLTQADADEAGWVTRRYLHSLVRRLALEVKAQRKRSSDHQAAD